MNKQEIARQELAKRQRSISILNECLPHQLSFIHDTAKRKAVLGTRRSSKTFAIALNLLSQALTVPKSLCIYCHLDKESAKRTIWTNILEPIIIKYNISATLNHKYEISFPNGSFIYLYGLDSSPQQKNKLRGQAYDIATIDEVQDFKQDLDDILDGVLRLTLVQTKATLILSGTPKEAIGNHYWWRIHNPDDHTMGEWKKFFFDWKDNTSIEPKTGQRICDAIQEDVNQQIASNPNIINDPRFQREYLGLWTILDNILVYQFHPHINLGNPPPALPNHWHYSMGVDFGWMDATAICIIAWHNSDPNAYVIHSEKHINWTLTQVALKIKELNALYHCSYIVGDSSARQSIEELAQHHSINMVPADRQGKFGFIQLINSDFLSGNIKISPTNNMELIKELQELTLDEKELRDGVMKEDASCQNHCTDAFCYAMRNVKHYRAKPPISPTPTSDQPSLQKFLDQANKYKPHCSAGAKPHCSAGAKPHQLPTPLFAGNNSHTNKLLQQARQQLNKR